MLVGNPEKVQIFGFVVLFPLTFTSGAFVRTATMPGWLQAFSKANPVTLLADATRGLMIGGPVAVPAVESLLYAAGFVAVFARSRSAPSGAGGEEPVESRPPAWPG